MQVGSLKYFVKTAQRPEKTPEMSGLKQMKLLAGPEHPRKKNKYQRQQQKMLIQNKQILRFMQMPLRPE